MQQMQPLVNNNGTSRAELCMQRTNTYHALIAAINTLGPMKPHGRDYCGDMERYGRDRAVWQERFNTLNQMADLMIAEGLAIHRGERQA